MAKETNKANDPQELEKVDSPQSINPPEGASDENLNQDNQTLDATSSDEEALNKEASSNEETNPKEPPTEATEEFGKLGVDELLVQLQKRTKAEKWFNDSRNIQEIILAFEGKFKAEIQEKKEAFIKEGGNEIDFFFRPPYKNEFDQLIRDYKKNKRAYFQQREQTQKLNLDRKLEIIESIKELINVDENINTIYKKFKNLQESWHKTGPVPRPQSNNIWQTYKHHTEIFYDFLHLNRELRDLDFKHNYEEKVKIIEQAEALSKIPDVLKASRDLNTLHRLWKNDLGPVAKEHREELWSRFQAASQIIHAKRQEFDKEYDNILEDNLNKKRMLLGQLDEIIANPPKSHNEWRKTIDTFNKIRVDFQSIGQVTKKYSKENWRDFREKSREINREKNQFYKSQKADQKNNIDLKKSLINEVKEILEHDDWRTYNNRMKNIQKDWKAIGFVPRKLSNLLWEEFRAQCNLYFDRIKSRYQKINESELEANKKKETFIQGISSLKIPPEMDAFIAFFEMQWEDYNQLGVLTGNTLSKSVESFRRAFISLINQSEMDGKVKQEAKSHVRLTLIKENKNELSLEIQNIKKRIDELKGEARQLENNLDYFSDKSNDNPLFLDVNSKLDQLRSEVENYQEQLVSFRKLKRELESRNEIAEATVEVEDQEEGEETEN